ncbi:fasciclin domain-containing protein [Deinococcus radiopugnans]|uniref:Fasciclin domain-containing protein n=1 Tax=Deinococcus radiopugnans ATCC 19172 TaxID=585398 RepID=A0A5C4Y245_9DEIO|nr:fasciclin domain-containing protein [Deinococcus radiopugnans]MBB6017856.1 putative surface protein with fasciclin (FAS1) repeats [Deinococcus radiopugnans ATCC 19172]TNM69578.1 fasciclin domain-containing protein [Deinococcus radiopugnans ATCC 19172]
MKKMLLCTTLLFTGVAFAGGGSSMPSGNTIAAIVSNDPNFSTLLAAVKAAGLVETLSSPGPFTVFAPTNAAFAKIPQADLNALLNDPAALKSVLLYHVVPGKVTASQVTGLTSATTVNGADLNISTSGGMVMINDATVTKADIMASNGVIHVIDTVLMP